MNRLDEYHDCLDCGGWFIPKYPQDNIVYCKKCATKRLFSASKKVTPELITKMLGVYEDIKKDVESKREEIKDD
jgi:hypothetical protein